MVLGLGILTVWLIVFVFRFTDNRLPTVLALAVTYGIAAYIVLPRIVRMSLKILSRKRVPRFTITGDGLPGDPVNLVLTGTLEQLRAAFKRAGWSDADRLGLVSSWRMIRAFFNSPYPTEHPLSFRSRSGRRFSEADRRQPAQAPSHSLLGLEPRLCRSRYEEIEFLAEYRPSARRSMRPLGWRGHQGYRHLVDAAHVSDHARHGFGHESGARLHCR